MQVANVFQTSAFLNLHSKWSRCPSIHPSIRHFPGNYTLTTRTERSSWKRKYIVFKVNYNAATSSDAGAGSENISDSVSDNSKTVELHKKGTLRLAIREANFGDYWEVADTHCGAFLPDLGFPMDAVMRCDRVLAMLGGFSLPNGRKRKCLVAVEGQFPEGPRRAGLPTGDLFLLAWKGFTEIDNSTGQEPHLERILGNLTVDTVAEFLPRRKPMGLRRSGIAYISNVAVRQRMRRRGIAKTLLREAEVVATSWGCRSIALHCDINNPGALALYLGAGYRLVRIPVGAKWPQPKAMPGSEFRLMMKYLPLK